VRLVGGSGAWLPSVGVYRWIDDVVKGSAV
jgi:hypothetical protein